MKIYETVLNIPDWANNLICWIKKKIGSTKNTLAFIFLMALLTCEIFLCLPIPPQELLLILNLYYYAKNNKHPIWMAFV